MNYKEARSKISNGDLIFIRGSKTRPIQSLIMWATNSPYTHCAIAFWAIINDNYRLMIVEAQGGTSRRILNMSFYEGRDIDVVSSPRDWEEYAVQATENLGIVKYGWLDAIYAGVRDKLNQYGFAISAKNLNSGEICSEFIAKCLNLENVNISPEELFKTVILAGNKVKLEIRK